jgi:hypothetical protein
MKSQLTGVAAPVEKGHALVAADAGRRLVTGIDGK